MSEEISRPTPNKTMRLNRPQHLENAAVAAAATIAKSVAERGKMTAKSRHPKEGPKLSMTLADILSGGDNDTDDENAPLTRRTNKSEINTRKASPGRAALGTRDPNVEIVGMAEHSPQGKAVRKLVQDSGSKGSRSAVRTSRRPTIQEEMARLPTRKSAVGDVRESRKPPLLKLSRTVSFSNQSETRSYSIEAPPNMLGDRMIEDTKAITPPAPRTRQPLQETGFRLPSVAETIVEDDQAFSFLDSSHGIFEDPRDSTKFDDNLNLMDLSELLKPETHPVADLLVHPSQRRGEVDEKTEITPRPLLDLLRDVGGWIEGLRVVPSTSSNSSFENESPAILPTMNQDQPAFVSHPDFPANSGYETEVILSDCTSSSAALSSTEVEATDLELDSTCGEAGQAPIGTFPLESSAKDSVMIPNNGNRSGSTVSCLENDGYQTEVIRSSSEDELSEFTPLSSSKMLNFRADTVGTWVLSDSEDSLKQPNVLERCLNSDTSSDDFEQLNVACDLIRLNRWESQHFEQRVASSVKGVLGLMLLDIPRYCDISSHTPKTIWSPEEDEDDDRMTKDEFPKRAIEGKGITQLKEQIQHPASIPVMVSAISESEALAQISDIPDTGSTFIEKEQRNNMEMLLTTINTPRAAHALSTTVDCVDIGVEDPWVPPNPIVSPGAPIVLETAPVTENLNAQEHPSLILRAETFEAPEMPIISMQSLDLSKYIRLSTFSPKDAMYRPRQKTKRNSSSKKRYPVHALGLESKRLVFGDLN